MGCSFRSGSNGRSCFIEKDEIKIAVIVFIFFHRDFLRSPPGHSLTPATVGRGVYRTYPDTFVVTV